MVPSGPKSCVYAGGNGRLVNHSLFYKSGFPAGGQCARSRPDAPWRPQARYWMDALRRVRLRPSRGLKPRGYSADVISTVRTCIMPECVDAI